MAMREQYPTRGVLRRPQLRWVDILIGAAVFALLYGVLRLGISLRAPFAPTHQTGGISTDPARLPVYALRSLARMFIALFLSLVFTFVYGTAAARLRGAGASSSSSPSSYSSSLSGAMLGAATRLRQIGRAHV